MNSNKTIPSYLVPKPIGEQKIPSSINGDLCHSASQSLSSSQTDRMQKYKHRIIYLLTIWTPLFLYPILNTLKPHTYYASKFTSRKNRKTYNNVCQKLYILFILKKCKLIPKINSMYVMLCYVISYYIYLSIYLLKLLIYKLYGIPYSMLCYSGG